MGRGCLPPAAGAEVQEAKVREEGIHVSLVREVFDKGWGGGGWKRGLERGVEKGGICPRTINSMSITSFWSLLSPNIM